MLVNEHIEGLSREHTVKPGMVYISQSTELGTIYSHKELMEKEGRYFELFTTQAKRYITDGESVNAGETAPSDRPRRRRRQAEDF